MKDTVAEEKYSELLELQFNVNEELKVFFNVNKSKGRKHLSQVLISKVEDIVDSLNQDNHNFGRCEYSGDINYENSEQTFSDGNELGEGVVLHFHGFSVQVRWEGQDKYGE